MLHVEWWEGIYFENKSLREKPPLWHHAKDLVIPENIRLIPQTAYSPELHPVEHVWDELREKYFHMLLGNASQQLSVVLDGWSERRSRWPGEPACSIPP